MLSLAKRVGRRAQTEVGEAGAPVRVGPYRLCLELAAGGMATVYLAHNGAPGASARFAAVKLVHSHLANDAGFAEMFMDEAEIASRIRHPHVCSVYDFDVSKERSYIAMEYLLGEPMGAIWRKLARARQKSPERTARLIARALADACEGLHAAHELTDDEGEPLEVVHRDVSPGNIVLTFDGLTKVVDFGVAAAARKRHRTQTGMLKGKLAYIAPEALRGERVDRRCDVWGVGVTAWELVTGQRLFRAKSDVDTLRAVVEAPIKPPSEVRSDLPKELDDILMLALERDPEARYETARDLGRDLARFACRNEVITTSDLGEWLDELFPGARARKQQLLEIAAQIAREEPEATVVDEPPRAPARERTPTPSELEPTRLYDRDPITDPTGPARTRRWRGWPTVIALGIGLGVGGSGTWILTQESAPPPVREHAPPAPLATAAPPPAPPEPERPQPELRIRPGGGLARGPYLLELVDSAPDELLLRVRFDGRADAIVAPAAQAAPPPTPPAAPRPWRPRAEASTRETHSPLINAIESDAASHDR